MPNAWDTLASLPEVFRLLRIIRADNSLLALGVESREVTWTKFLAWLFDPTINNSRATRFADTLVRAAAPAISASLPCDNRDGRRHLERCLALVGERPTTVVSSRAEQREGERGRSDVVVEVEYATSPLTILIENKIEAAEQENQLQGYVEHRLARMPDHATLLPLFVQLGDDPDDACSCGWAVVWSREDVADWFESAIAACDAAEISVPRLIGDYLELFAAWDLARILRTQQRGLIEDLQQTETKHFEWGLLKSWITISDESFFQDVLDTDIVQDQIRQHHLETATSGSVLGRNELLQAWKTHWTLPSPGPGSESVNVHFECRYRGEIQLDVEIDPYEGSLSKKPDRLKTLERQLLLKQSVTEALRARILLDPALKNQTGAHKRYLRAADQPSTCCAVKFDKGLNVNCAVDDFAEFVASVLENVAPVVDEVIEKTMAARPQPNFPYDMLPQVFRKGRLNGPVEAVLPVYSQNGKQITGDIEESWLESWFQLAPPASGEKQWKDGRSAKELARAWFPGNRPADQMPVDLGAVLGRARFVPLLAIAEFRAELDGFAGNARNHDLMLVGSCLDNRERILVTIEAKADESFGNSTIAKYREKGVAKAGSKIPHRIDRLVRSLFGQMSDEVGALRYQLLHAIGSTLIEAHRCECAQAIFIVHEFRSDSCSLNNLNVNASDLTQFLRVLSKDQQIEIAPGTLLGPFRVPGDGADVPGGHNLPDDVPLYVGKAVTSLSPSV